jgi:hypothetical protein
VGIYETYGGTTVEILEERAPRCPDASHREGQVTRRVGGGPDGHRKHVAA